MCKKTKGLHNRIDKCMKPFIEYLTDYLPHRVVACCCGHGFYPMTVVVEIYNRRSGERTFLEIFSNKIIPRTRNFYKKDSKGYYFIKEVSQEK